MPVPTPKLTPELIVRVAVLALVFPKIIEWQVSFAVTVKEAPGTMVTSSPVPGTLFPTHEELVPQFPPDAVDVTAPAKLAEGRKTDASTATSNSSRNILFML
jgi:hypothetical protein